MVSKRWHQLKFNQSLKRMNKRNTKQELKNDVGVVDKDEIELKEAAFKQQEKE